MKALQSRTPLFTIPPEDADEFQRLPDHIRADVDRLLVEFESIAAAPKIRPALAGLAARLNHRRGFRFGSLRSKFYAYYTSGDWRVLVDKARCTRRQLGRETSRDIHLPHDFVEFLRGLFQSNQRKSEPAIRLLYRMWRAGDSIPGYGTWQEWFLSEHPYHPLPEQCPPDMPRGWSRGNLRRYIPEEADLALARRGIAAARAHLPDVITTREGLRPLELVMFDDVRTDFRILVPGFSSPVGLNLLVCIDVATGLPLRYGVRPEITREDGVKDRLKLHDMKCLIAGLLMQYGMPRHYQMTMVVENATAAIRDGTELALREISDNRIVVSRTMMINGTAIWGGYKDKAMGNPRGKGALESTFNLLHNENGFAPGQVGRRYDAGPAELAGRTGEANSLVKVSRHLTPQQRAALRLPFLTLDQARVVLTDSFNRMIARDDHAMEGFETVGEWRLAKFDQWRPECELATVSPEEIERVEWRNPPRRESPLERWHRLVELVGGDQAFTKLHPGAVMRLYSEHLKKTIDNSEIVFRFQKETFVYRIANALHARTPLQNEMEVLVYFDPQDLGLIHVTDGKGGYLCSIPRTRGARRVDKAAMQAQFDQQRKALHELQDRVSRRMPHVPEERLAALTHNNAVLSDALADQQAIDLAPATGAAQLPPPDAARQILRASLASQVQARQVAAAQPSPDATPDDCTADLLARESEADTETANEWD